MLAEVSKLEKRVDKIEAALSASWQSRPEKEAEPSAWPHSIVDDEKEIPGAGWVLPKEMRPIYEGDWREFAASHGLDPDKLTNQNIVGSWQKYFSKKALREIVRDVRGE